MTQENDNSTPSDASAPKKTASKPKKTTAGKTSVKKAAPAKSTAKAPASAKKAVAAKPAAKTDESSTTDLKKAAPVKTAAKKPAAKKPAAKAEPAAKPTKESSTDSPAAKTPPAKKTAVAKTEKGAAKVAAEPKEPAKSTKKTAAAKPKATPASKSAVKDAQAKEAKREPAPAKAAIAEIPASGDEKKPATKKSASRSAGQKTEVASAPEAVPAQTSTEEAPEQKEGTPRSSSRRSRRGGRRRNKKAAQETAANDALTPEEDESAVKAPVEAEGAMEPEGKTAQKDAKPGKKPAKEAAAKKGGSTKTASQKAEPAQVAKTSSGKRKMFISVLSGELVEVVLADEGQVQEYYVEMQHQAKVKGNIYKGVISNIDANLQAAFVSYAGGVKNGFLQIDEVHPEYYIAHHDPAKGRKYPPIQKVLKPGQEILVQVVKEPAGTKGAFLTSYLSLPGRFLVLTPGREQIGVSRKVENDAERSRLRTILDGLSLGAGLGVIVRTVSSDASKTSLSRDLQFLKRLWKEVRAKGQTQPSPSLIYEELDLSTRAIRDYLTDDVQEVWVDDEDTGKQVAELASLLFPKKQNLVQVHHDTGHTLFERFSLQKQLDQIHSRDVSLPSGGRLVIDNTEALTAIDINSGRSSGKSNFEDMAFRTNLEAAKSIPLQLRLRDIGGQVVIDFIEMRDRDHWREVEKAVRNGMKGDRARYDVGKIGPFGLLEIVRQRLGSSAISVSTEPCPCCKGTGIRRNMEWQAMQCLRDISRALRQAAANNQTALSYPTESELAFYLLNAKRSILQKMEEESGVMLSIRPAGE